MTASVSFETFPMGEGEWTDFFNPDQFIRQAVQNCWMSLPKDRRNPEELEKQIHRLVERALKDFREDREAFGKGIDTSREGKKGRK